MHSLHVGTGLGTIQHTKADHEKYAYLRVKLISLHMELADVTRVVQNVGVTIGLARVFLIIHMFSEIGKTLSLKVYVTRP